MAKKTSLTFLKNSTIKVGWPDGNLTADVAYQHLMIKKATGENQPSIKKPVSMALIARTLNYGREPGVTAEGRKYGRIPARPFMKLAEENFRKLLPKLFKAYIPDVIAGKMTQQQMMEAVGSRMAGEVKDAMLNGSWEPLSPRTVKARRHGGNKPLFDTGTLVASVSFQVDNGKIVKPK